MKKRLLRFSRLGQYRPRLHLSFLRDFYLQLKKWFLWSLLRKNLLLFISLIFPAVEEDEILKRAQLCCGLAKNLHNPFFFVFFCFIFSLLAHFWFLFCILFYILMFFLAVEKDEDLKEGAIVLCGLVKDLQHLLSYYYYYYYFPFIFFVFFIFVYFYSFLFTCFYLFLFTYFYFKLWKKMKI